MSATLTHEPLPFTALIKVEGGGVKIDSCTVAKTQMLFHAEQKPKMHETATEKQLHGIGFLNMQLDDKVKLFYNTNLSDVGGIGFNYLCYIHLR